LPSALQATEALATRRGHPLQRRSRLEVGELERLVTQKLLDVVKRLAREELQNERWVRLVARLSHRRYEQMRVLVLEFLDTDIFNLSAEQCVAFLDPLIESWDIDLAMFGVEIILSRRVAREPLKKPGRRSNF
jgi:hypothetical protein